MSPPPTYEVVALPAEMRAIARRGEWRGSTGGQCPAYQQANLVILPKEAAAEFAAFCTRNPKPCPLIEITPPGDLGIKPSGKCRRANKIAKHHGQLPSLGCFGEGWDRRGRSSFRRLIAQSGDRR